MDDARRLTELERAEWVAHYRGDLAQLREDEALRQDVAVAILEAGEAPGVLWLVSEMLKRGRAMGLIDDLAMGAGGAALDLLESTLRALTQDVAQASAGDATA